MPIVPASALSVSPIWSRSSAGERRDVAVRERVVAELEALAMQPSNDVWMAHDLAADEKNVAGTWRRVSAAAMRGVQRGLGPSSNVSAIRLPGSAHAIGAGRRSTRGSAWPESDPPLLGAGVALRPVVLVDRPWAPSRTSGREQQAQDEPAERARREVFKSALLRRRWRWVESLPHLAGRGGRRCGRGRLADAPAVARRRRRSGRRLADLARRSLVVSPRPASCPLSRVHCCDRRRRSGLGRGAREFFFAAALCRARVFTATSSSRPARPRSPLPRSSPQERASGLARGGCGRTLDRRDGRLAREPLTSETPAGCRSRASRSRDRRPRDRPEPTPR